MKQGPQDPQDLPAQRVRRDRTQLFLDRQGLLARLVRKVKIHLLPARQDPQDLPAQQVQLVLRAVLARQVLQVLPARQVPQDLQVKPVWVAKQVLPDLKVLLDLQDLQAQIAM